MAAVGPIKVIGAGLVGTVLGAGAFFAVTHDTHVAPVEGGYADDPADLGGKTNLGITEAVARRHGYTGDMRDLTDSLAYHIYYLSLIHISEPTRPY